MNRLMAQAVKFFNWVSKLDYSNPPVILTAIGVILLPFVAKYYVMAGLMLGLVHAIGLLWLVDKMPNSLKRLLHKYPVAADLTLSFGAVYLVGSMFGEGLTLGLGALFCTVIMSLCLPHIRMKDEEPAASNNEQQGEFCPA